MFATASFLSNLDIRSLQWFEFGPQWHVSPSGLNQLLLRGYSGGSSLVLTLAYLLFSYSLHLVVHLFVCLFVELLLYSAHGKPIICVDVFTPTSSIF